MIRSDRDIRQLFTVVMLLSICSCLMAQDEEWVSDPRGDAYVSAGKKLLAQGHYDRAREAFDSALMRPFHPRTTSASYLKGLTWFYQGESDSAHAVFSDFLEAYPESHYVPEATYHQAILLLEGWPDTQAEGLDDLVQLWMQDSLTDLSISARNKVSQYVFKSCDTSSIHRLRDTLGPGYPLPLQAECYCLKEHFDQEERAKRLYEEHLRSGEPIPFLERLFDPRREDRYGDRENIRIAIFLPLFLQESAHDSIPDVPRKSRVALEFWEGIQMAYEELEPKLKNRFTLQVFDTRRDSQTVENLVRDLDAWYPDLVVGAVYNTQTEIISQWSERTGTPQIVPFSPSQKLVEGKLFTFLAHPDIEVHGRELAHYGFDSLEMRKVAVFTNQTQATEQLVHPFIEAIQTRGGEVIRVAVDSVFDEETAKDMISMIKSLRLQEYDGIFIPIFGDQETAGLILSQISVMDMQAPVMASPHIWKRFTSIDRELKERYKVTFSTSYMPDSRDTAYVAYLNRCLEEYHIPPSDFHTQGYDLGVWMLTVLNEYPFRYLSLADYIRNYPLFQGFHQALEFGGQQINQTVNLGQFTEEGVIRLRQNQPWVIAIPDEE